MRAFQQFASVSALCAVIGAAGCYERPPSWEPARVVYEFEGVVRNGDVQLWGYPVGEDFAESMAARQALSPIAEDRNGDRGTAAVANSIELAVVRDPNGPYPLTGVVAGGCGTSDSFDLRVGVRNFHPVRLTNTHIEITSIRDNVNPAQAPDHYAFCNSEPVTPNLLVDGVPVSNALGLVRYGNLGQDENGFDLDPVGVTTDANGPVPEPLGTDATAHVMLWRFRNGSTTASFSFNGRVVADVCADAGCVPGTVSAPRGVDTDGLISAVAEGPGVVYVGGNFSRIGPRTGAAFRTAADPTQIGAADVNFPAFEGGSVEVIVPDGAGGYYVGGSFTHVAGNAAPRLVRLTPDGVGFQVSTGFNPTSVTANGTVQDIELDATNNRLWVGRIEAPFLSIIDATSGAANALTLTDIPNNSIRQITKASETRMIVAGNFTNLGERNRDKLAIYNPATGVLQPLAMPVSGGGAREVESFVVVGDTLYIAGDFTSVGSGSANARNRLAAIDLAASNGRGSLLPWNPNANAQVFALVVDQGTNLVYVGGAFTTVNGVTRNRLAALTADTSVASPVPTAFNPGASNTVNALALDGTRLLVGGQFTNLAGVGRNRLGAVDTLTSTALAFDPSVTGPAGAAVRAITIDGGNYVFGGLFNFGGGTPAASLAAIDPANGSHLAGFTGGVAGGVINAIATSGSDVYVGGTFATANGQARANLAGFTSSGALLAFNPGPSTTVRGLAADASGLYVVGDFASIAGVTRQRVARLTLPAGANDATFTPPTFNAAVRAVAVGPEGVFVGGDFTAPATRAARLGSNGALAANLNANGSVRALAVRHQRLYVAGDFTSLAGGARTRVGAVQLVGNVLDPTFAPAGPDTRVDAIAVAGNTVVVGGTFATPRPRLAAFDNVSGALQSFAPLPVADGTTVGAVAIVGPVVIAGGEYAAGGSLVNVAGLSVRRSSLVLAHAE